ncbi:MAG TPA: thioesterase family protein [Bacteroidota bacterium]|nr:thioesterase family protein [Bacteroidota bacterium]
MTFSETKIRVRYADTDQMKIVYYGKFFEYFEQGRSDLLRKIGMPYPEIERMGYLLPVIEAHANYLKSALYDEEITVKTIVEEIPQVRIRIKYVVYRDTPDQVLVEGYTIHSFVNAEKKTPTRAPAAFTELLAEQLK